MTSAPDVCWTTIIDQVKEMSGAMMRIHLSFSSKSKILHLCLVMNQIKKCTKHKITMSR